MKQICILRGSPQLKELISTNNNNNNTGIDGNIPSETDGINGGNIPDSSDSNTGGNTGDNTGDTSGDREEIYENLKACQWNPYSVSWNTKLKKNW